MFRSDLIVNPPVRFVNAVFHIHGVFSLLNSFRRAFSAMFTNSFSAFFTTLRNFFISSKNRLPFPSPPSIMEFRNSPKTGPHRKRGKHGDNSGYCRQARRFKGNGFQSAQRRAGYQRNFTKNDSGDRGGNGIYQDPQEGQPEALHSHGKSGISGASSVRIRDHPRLPPDGGACGIPRRDRGCFGTAAEIGSL